MLLFEMSTCTVHLPGCCCKKMNLNCPYVKIVSENDHEIPQSQTADKPMAPQGGATQESRDTRKTN